MSGCPMTFKSKSTLSPHHSSVTPPLLDSKNHDSVFSLKTVFIFICLKDGLTESMGHVRRSWVQPKSVARHHQRSGSQALGHLLLCHVHLAGSVIEKVAF